MAVARSLVRLRDRMGPFDLEMILMRDVDEVSHQYWKFYEPDAAAYSEAERPSPDEVERYGGTIEDHYRLVDSLVGEVCSHGARDRIVLLVSDHGFEAGRQYFRGTSLSGMHQSKAAVDGIFIASEGSFRRAVRVEHPSILDIGPTVLHLLGLPLAADLEGRVLDEAFEPRGLPLIGRRWSPRIRCGCPVDRRFPPVMKLLPCTASATSFARSDTFSDVATVVAIHGPRGGGHGGSTTLPRDRYSPCLRVPRPKETRRSCRASQ